MMRRPWQIWGVFLASLTLVALAVGWLSLRAWEADLAEADARELAALEEDVRLALWRMDSIVAPFIAQESVRPPTAFQLARRSAANTGPGLQFQQSTLPAAAFAQSVGGEFIQLYFQINSECRMTSPQVWYSDLANAEGATGSSSTDHEHGLLLDQLRTWLDVQHLERQLPRLDVSQGTAEQAAAPERVRSGRTVVVDDANSSKYQSEVATQQSRGQNEFQARRQSMAGNALSALTNRGQESATAGTDFEISPFQPVVQRGELLLVRRARIGTEEFLQGCWLNWELLEQELQQKIADLLPGSRLSLLTEGAADPSRTMASLPVGLVVQPVAATIDQPLSAVRSSLVLAWGAMLLAALAVAVLLRGVVTLSERRASFVSAVTHELRTPLTTFRMYSEMLADGMVKEPDRQAQYLRTLRVEADRLSHLVENVLAYARLERGGLGNRMASVPASELVATATARAAERAAQGGMEFSVVPPAADSPLVVWADPSAVEQIVFNLVDNACKYAAQGEQRRIEVTSRREGAGFVLQVRDFGPGISSARRRLLFQAFSKSADEAAHSAPGVGLGLALSQRLARDMGGDLKLDECIQEGSAFVLTLRCVAGRLDSTDGKPSPM